MTTPHGLREKLKDMFYRILETDEMNGHQYCEIMANGYADDVISLILSELPEERDIRGAVARGWCHKANENKVMDLDLANAITEEVIAEMRQKWGEK